VSPTGSDLSVSPSSDISFQLNVKKRKEKKRTLVGIYRHGDIHKADKTRFVTIKTSEEGHHTDKLHH
jgi:hypothetical protein